MMLKDLNGCQAFFLPDILSTLPPPLRCVFVCVCVFGSTYASVFMANWWGEGRHKETVLRTSCSLFSKLSYPSLRQAAEDGSNADCLCPKKETVPPLKGVGGTVCPVHRGLMHIPGGRKEPVGVLRVLWVFRAKGTLKHCQIKGQIKKHADKMGSEKDRREERGVNWH